jgi:hypothetical protein
MTNAHTENVEPIPQRGLSRVELEHLVSEAIREWDAGGEMPSLERIRLHGSVADYELAVNRVRAHDDTRRDREIQREIDRGITRLRAPRAD